MAPLTLTLDQIYQASFALRDMIRKTDLIPAPALGHDCQIFLKSENLQVTGSFKVRGASYKISRLSLEERKKGVIACSAGNHAQGVALAAAKNQIKSLICIPEGAPISKVEATRRYGAEVLLVNGVYDDAYNKACAIQEESGATFIHPFNDSDVIAGQGTIGLEILDQLPDVDIVLVPVGGGGLISGIAFAIKTLKPDCKIYGVQAAGAPSMLRSLEKRQPETLDSVLTIADGIAVKRPGDLTYEICQKYVDGIVTVTDDEISTAILALIEQQKMIAEGAGAVAIAAAMFQKVKTAGKKVVCVVSGGNIDVNILSRVIKRGLLKTGRSTQLTIELPDKPGQLRNISALVADLGANVVNVRHDRSGEDTDINACYLRLTMETRDRSHIEQIRQAILDAGYKIVQQL